MTQDHFDVIVVGGGPAGSAAATLIQRAGHRCLLLEDSQFPRYRIGESLVPQTYLALDRLGLLPAMRESAFPVKRSVRFVSPAGNASQPFYFDETVEGDRARTWQVERGAFDTLLLDTAREAGVEVRTQTRVEAVLFDGDSAVGVRAWSRSRGDGREPYDVGSRVVVDASGWSCLIGRQLDLRAPIDSLNKASAWAYFKGGARAEGVDAGETTILMRPGRDWFWYIPLPDDVVSVGMVGDPQRVLGGAQSHEAAFESHVAACSVLAERLAGAERVGKVRAIRRLAYTNRRTSGDGWVMVGDARAFLDPVYSSGVFLALASATLAADCIIAGLAAGDTSAATLGAFEAQLNGGVNVVSQLIHAFYDERFSFRAFVERYPEQRAALIDCLVGDILGDMSAFTDALAEMRAAPPRAPDEGG